MKTITKLCEWCELVFTQTFRRVRDERRTCCKQCHAALKAQSRTNTIIARKLALPSPPPVKGGVWLPLSAGKFALVDKSRFAELCKLSWSYGRNGYARRNVNGNDVFLHKYLLGAGKAQQVDHKNGNRLDDRIRNLRLATVTQQRANQSKWKKKCSSKYKGVHRGTGDRWSAHIGNSRIGLFKSEILAARAYDKAARKRYGEFAAVNFPRRGERCALH